MELARDAPRLLRFDDARGEGIENWRERLPTRTLKTRIPLVCGQVAQQQDRVVRVPVFDERPDDRSRLV